MKFKKILHLLFTLLLSFSTLTAVTTNAPCPIENNLSRPLTLAELLDTALANHPSTKQAWWNAKRAAAAIESAKSVYYPQLSFETFLNTGKDFKFINGPDTSYTIAGADLFLSLLLYDFGATNATVEMAQEALVAANWQVDFAIQKVMVRVLENAYSTLYAQEALQAAEDSLRDAEKVLLAAKELNRTGLTSVSDVYTTQANVSQMKMEVTQQRADLDIQRGKLAISLGLPASTCLQVATLPCLAQQQMEALDKLIAVALSQRADLMAKQADLQATLLDQKRVRAGYFPTIACNGRGGYNHAFRDKADGGQYQLSLNLNIPLFNGFDTLYQQRIAYADTQISTEELAELQLEITLEVLTHSRLLTAAQEMLPDAEDNFNSALKAYEGTLDKYRAGKERIAEVSNAQQQLAAARVRYSDVKTRQHIAIANLAYATGTLAPYTEASCDESF
jgi:outer membrane protein